MPKWTDEEKVYEYFKLDEIFISGRFKNYVDAMWVQNKIQESYFKRLVDLYAIAAIVGFRIGRKEENDPSEEKRTIQLKQLNENYNVLMPIMRLILILDVSRGRSVEERVDEAFRNPENEETYRKNMDLFNSYARGGIHYLYEQLVLRAPDLDDDIADTRIANIIALLKAPLIPEI